MILWCSFLVAWQSFNLWMCHVWQNNVALFQQWHNLIFLFHTYFVQIFVHLFCIYFVLLLLWKKWNWWQRDIFAAYFIYVSFFDQNQYLFDYSRYIQKTSASTGLIVTPVAARKSNPMRWHRQVTIETRLNQPVHEISFRWCGIHISLIQRNIWCCQMLPVWATSIV